MHALSSACGGALIAPWLGQCVAQIVDQQTQEAEAKKVVVVGEEAVANEKAAAAKAIKDECEADLAVAMPLLESALKVRACAVRHCCTTAARQRLGRAVYPKLVAVAGAATLRATCTGLQAAGD